MWRYFRSIYLEFVSILNKILCNICPEFRCVTVMGGCYLNDAIYKALSNKYLEHFNFNEPFRNFCQNLFYLLIYYLSYNKLNTTEFFGGFFASQNARTIFNKLQVCMLQYCRQQQTSDVFIV